MPADRWAERCGAQRVHFLEGERPQRTVVFGFVLARNRAGVYPVGSFEMCDETAVFPPQTLNPTEEESMLAAATGLARMWDGTGILTLRFAKQRDGADFALTDAEEEMSAEAKHLLTLRGLYGGGDTPFLNAGEPPPELLEIPVVGVSDGDKLYTAGNLRSALLQLPDSVRAGFVGWYERILRL